MVIIISIHEIFFFVYVRKRMTTIAQCRNPKRGITLVIGESGLIQLETAIVVYERLQKEREDAGTWKYSSASVADLYRQAYIQTGRIPLAVYVDQLEHKTLEALVNGHDGQLLEFSRLAHAIRSPAPAINLGRAIRLFMGHGLPGTRFSRRMEKSDLQAFKAHRVNYAEEFRMYGLEPAIQSKVLVSH
jgi:hypothetical protein